MTKYTAYKFVTGYLKTHPGSTIEQLLTEYGHTTLEAMAEVQEVVRDLFRKNAIVSTADGGIKYHQVLDPIVKRHKGFFETIGPQMPVQASYTNPTIKDIAPRDQGDRGTCVGQGCANVKDILYATLNGVPADWKTGYKKDVHDPDGVIHDNLYFSSTSAECIYQKSRELGHIVFPSGSYTYLGLSALTKLGAAYEDQWPTSKTSYCVLKTPREDKKSQAYATMPAHMIDGYSQLLNNTFDGCCAMIEKYGCVAASFDIYENYGQMAGGDGTFPEPKGSVIGGHCLCLYGYTPDYILCLHSWGDWCGRFGKISRHYYDIACNDIFMPIDKTELARFMEEYVRISCGCNTRANFYLVENGVKNYIGTYPDTDVSIRLKKDVEVTFFVESINYYNLNMTEKYTPTMDGLFIVKLPIPPLPEPDGLWQAILAWLRKVFYK